MTDSELLDWAAMVIPGILSWKEFLKFREQFIETYEKMCN